MTWLQVGMAVVGFLTVGLAAALVGVCIGFRRERREAEMEAAVRQVTYDQYLADEVERFIEETLR